MGQSARVIQADFPEHSYGDQGTPPGKPVDMVIKATARPVVFLHASPCPPIEVNTGVDDTPRIVFVEDDRSDQDARAQASGLEKLLDVVALEGDVIVQRQDEIVIRGPQQDVLEPHVDRASPPKVTVALEDCDVGEVFPDELGRSVHGTIVDDGHIEVLKGLARQQTQALRCGIDVVADWYEYVNHHVVGSQ